MFKSISPKQIIGAAIEVHRALGPGLLEFAYEEWSVPRVLLSSDRLPTAGTVTVEYKGVQLDCAYRIDVVVEDAVILELKCVEHVLPVHEAQLLTYLKLTGKRVGLIINFHVATLVRGGIVRKVI